MAIRESKKNRNDPCKKNEDIMASDDSSKFNKERRKCYQKMKEEFKSYQKN
jgi:hypothetical protein